MEFPTSFDKFAIFFKNDPMMLFTIINSIHDGFIEIMNQKVKSDEFKEQILSEMTKKDEIISEQKSEIRYLVSVKERIENDLAKEKIHTRTLIKETEELEHKQCDDIDTRMRLDVFEKNIMSELKKCIGKIDNLDEQLAHHHS